MPYIFHKKYAEGFHLRSEMHQMVTNLFHSFFSIIMLKKSHTDNVQKENQVKSLFLAN